MHNYRSNQSALMTRFGTDLRHQYGIFGGKSQTSFTRNATLGRERRRTAVFAGYEHRRSVDKTNIQSKPTTVAERFLSHPNHCLTDMQLIPLEIIHSSRDSIRKARESFLIDLGRTLEPHDMNRRDES